MGNSQGSLLRQLDGQIQCRCRKWFEPEWTVQKWCTPKCEDRFRKRDQRDERASQGLCLQCGGVKDKKSKSNYCDNCRTYWRKYQQKRLKGE